MSEPAYLQKLRSGEALSDELDFEQSPAEMWVEVQHE